MEQFTTFIEKYFYLIAVAIFLWTSAIFYFRGRSIMRKFGSIDNSTIVYAEYSASGYSSKSWITKYGGSSKMLHIIITQKELILSAHPFIAYIAKKYDLLHRIPLKKITNIKIENGIKSKLHVFFTSENGDNKEIVLISKKNKHIKELLDDAHGFL